MHSHRMLGAVALGAVVVSAISFAVVDVSIANANGCLGEHIGCVDQSIPMVAVTFAILGLLTLAISVVPAVQWFVRALHHAREHDAHDETPDAEAVEQARQRILHRLTLEKVDLREESGV